MATAGVRVGTRARDLLEKVAVRLVPGRADKADRESQRWLVVTIEADVADLESRGQLPGPLAELGDSIEVEVRPGPGRWGTEIAARPASTGSSTEADRQGRERLRSALRKSKQLLEVGEVLVAEPRPAGRRPATVAGKLVDRAERKADEEGVL